MPLFGDRRQGSPVALSAFSKRGDQEPYKVDFPPDDVSSFPKSACLEGIIFFGKKSDIKILVKKVEFYATKA